MALSEGEKAGLAVGLTEVRVDLDSAEIALSGALDTLASIPTDDPDVYAQLTFFRGLIYSSWLWSMALDKELRGLSNKLELTLPPRGVVTEDSSVKD